MTAPKDALDTLGTVNPLPKLVFADWPDDRGGCCRPSRRSGSSR